MPPRLELLAPANRSREVPLNTRIWIGNGTDLPAFALTLVDAEGTEIRLGSATIVGGIGSVQVLTPERELEAQTEYTLRAGQERAPLSFRTGSVADREPPPVPTLSNFDETEATSASLNPLLHVAGSCGDGSSQASVGMDMAFEGLIGVVQVKGRGQLDALSPSGTVSELLVTGGRFFVMGEPESQVTFAVGAFDLAGNFSGFSPEATFTLPGTSGCSSASGSPILTAALALIPALLRRRRGGAAR